MTVRDLSIASDVWLRAIELALCELERRKKSAIERCELRRLESVSYEIGLYTEWQRNARRLAEGERSHEDRPLP